MTVVKKKVSEIFKKKSEEKASTMGFQGQMLSLLAQEEEDIAWKSSIYRVPRGVMAWAVRASTNTLATPDNLARWGRPVDLKCCMEGCNATNTLGHILSNCNKALDRFKFRHDSVLKHLLDEIRKKNKEGLTVYADLNGLRVNGGTVPPDLALTGQVPDLVLIDRSVTPTRVVLLELTVPWDSAHCFKGALDRKCDRYERLTIDLKSNGYDSLNMPLEIGCRGVINSRNHCVLAEVCSMVGIRGLKKLRGTLGRLALLGSYRIWLARKSQEWSPGELLSSGQ